LIDRWNLIDETFSRVQNTEVVMLLYDNRHAPSPRRVRIFLKEKDIDVPTVPVDILEGGNLAPDFQRVSPRGLLPVLRLDDGTVIDETDAICRYFEELKPEPSLFGLTAVEKALVASWSRRAEFDGMAGVADVFRNSVPPMANRGVPGRSGDPQIPQLVERGKITVARFYQMLDDRLASARYLAGLASASPTSPHSAPSTFRPSPA